MTDQGTLMFAVFASRERADEVRAELDAAANVDLIITPLELRARVHWPGQFAPGLGLLLAASLMVGFVIAGFGALVLTVAGALPQPVPAAYSSAAVAVVLAAMLGGLAGWFAFASHSRIELHRLCSLLEHGHALLLFPACSECEDHMLRRGAVQMGTLT
jgi:hypothetical protein